MGKRNPKASVGSRKIAETSHSSSIPLFDKTVLSALTAKIEKGLGKRKTEQVEDSTRSRKQGRVGNSASIAEAKSKTNRPDNTRGTKRDAQGKTKQPNTKTVKKKSNPEKRGDREGLDESAMLLQEILALGGTEEDLDLVADVVSDEEDESTNSAKGPDKTFQKDLAKFVADLGIEQENIEEPESDIENRDENDEEEVSDISDGSSEVGYTSKAVADIKTSPSLETASSNGINRLVSSPPISK